MSGAARRGCGRLRVLPSGAVAKRGKPEGDRVRNFLAWSGQVVSGGDIGQDALAAALHDLVALLREVKSPYALIGAFAVAGYVAERRSTTDIDVVAAPDQWERIRAASGAHHFEELPKGDDALIRSFMHRGGVRVDLILDDHGAFADLEKTNVVQVPGIGTVRVASAVDVAWSKLRTQSRNWTRDPQKRASDYSDLIGMLRRRPALAAELALRLVRGADPYDMRANLRRACADAGVPPPSPRLRLAAPRRLAILVVGVLVVAIASYAVWKLL